MKRPLGFGFQEILCKIGYETCDGEMLEIYLGHKFQCFRKVLNCESLAYKVII